MDENPVQGLGFINRLKNRLSQVDQRTALDAFIVLLILIGLAASVYLAGQRQIFHSRASQDGSADVVNEQGQALPKNEDGSVIVETQQIRLKIIPPTTWNQTQGSVFQLVNNRAYAQQSSCGSTWTDGRSTSCYPDTSAPASGCDYLWAWSRDDSNPNKENSTCGADVPYCWACPSQQSAPTPTSGRTLAPAVTKGITCESINGQCGNSDWVLRGSSATCSGINRSYKGYNNGVNYTDCDTLQGNYPYCYAGCETAGGAALATGACRPLRPNEVISEPPSADQKTLDPSSYLWKTDCSKSCSDKSECPRNIADPSNVVPETSNWCYGFEGGKRCLQLQYIGGRGGVQEPTLTPTSEEETPAKVRISLNQASVKKDGSCSESSDLTQTCKEVTTLDLSAKGNIIDWQLPSQPGTYPIYVGFISNKGGYKDAAVTVTYKPKGGTISGKLTIKANGQRYKDVWIGVLKTKENLTDYGDLIDDFHNIFNFPSSLPTDQDQEISFSIPNLTESKYVLVLNLMTEDGKHIGALSRIICPDSPAGRYGCLVNTGSTDVALTLEIPPAGEAAVSQTPTITLPNSIILNVTLHLQGIGNGRGENKNPLHTERNLSILLNIYDPADDFTDEPSGVRGHLILYQDTGKIVYRPTIGAFTADFYILKDSNKLKLQKKIGKHLTAEIWIAGYLSRQLTFTFDARSRQFVATSNDPLIMSQYPNLRPLFAGDVEEDNTINATDLNIVEKDCFETKWQTASCAYKDMADVNDDGKVDIVDANLVRINLGKKGD